MLVAVIIGCEIGFWVLVAAGLLARYPLHRPGLGAVLLALTPVADLVLLAVTALDLHRGATAHLVHGIAALYLGFSLAYGRAMIRWADVRFAHRFADGPAPVRLCGAAYTRHCWQDVLRTSLACAVAAGVLTLLTMIADDPDRTAAFGELWRILGIVLVVDLLWAISYTFWPRQIPASSEVAQLRTVDRQAGR